MLGIGVIALKATQKLSRRRDAWIDPMTQEFARPRRDCTCEACVAYFAIIDQCTRISEVPDLDWHSGLPVTRTSPP